MRLNNFFSTLSTKKKALFMLLLLIVFFVVFINVYANLTSKKLNFETSENLEDNLPIPTAPVITEPPTATKPPIATEPPKILQPIINEEREKYNNQDVFAVLKIPDTVIDYPVLQSTDNDYYLLKDANKNYSVSGSLFFDYENTFEEKNKHYIIYGHNMNSNIMFHSLRYYKDKEYYNKHKYITLETPYETQTFEVFSFYKTSVDFYYLSVYFDTDADFLDLANQMKEKSIYDTGLEIEAKDTILTLSTCSNQETTTRYVLNAKLIKSVPYTDTYASSNSTPKP